MQMVAQWGLPWGILVYSHSRKVKDFQLEISSITGMRYNRTGPEIGEFRELGQTGPVQSRLSNPINRTGPDESFLTTGPDRKSVARWKTNNRTRPDAKISTTHNKKLEKLLSFPGT